MTSSKIGVICPFSKEYDIIGDVRNKADWPVIGLNSRRISHHPRRYIELHAAISYYVVFNYCSNVLLLYYINYPYCHSDAHTGHTAIADPLLANSSDQWPHDQHVYH